MKWWFVKTYLGISSSDDNLHHLKSFHLPFHFSFIFKSRNYSFYIFFMFLYTFCFVHVHVLLLNVSFHIYITPLDSICFCGDWYLLSLWIHNILSFLFIYLFIKFCNIEYHRYPFSKDTYILYVMHNILHIKINLEI